MYVACAKAVGDCGSIVGVNWSQPEAFVLFIIVSTSSSSCGQHWYVHHDLRN
jgi:hypothetical protein